MSRNKSSKPGLVPWLSARGDGKEKRFIQIGNILLLSEKFRDLGAVLRKEVRHLSIFLAPP